MALSSRQLRLWAVMPALACAAVLGGCGTVQFEGKAFDMIGLGENTEQTDKKMADRAPLIVPPSPSLPQPGAREQIAQPQNWPQDPDIVRKQMAEAQKKKDNHCSEVNLNKTKDFDDIVDPLRRCKGLFGHNELTDEQRERHPSEMSASQPQ